MNIQTKQDLRERILTLLKNQKEEERLIKSSTIKDELFKHNDIQNAGTILFYASFDGEVNTFDMINKAKELGKRVALPRTNSHDMSLTLFSWDGESRLEPGPFGIKQPKNNQHNRLDYNDLDAVIVPGVAFDKQNHRLGRGAGYYDRFLSLLGGKVPSFGLAFDFQCVESIPQIDDHDMPVSRVVHN